MADTKISELPAASAANDTDQIPANQAGTTRRLTVAQIVARVTSLAWSAITGTPTTLSGYGITDAAAASDLTTHAADTTSVHGIADTSALLTSAAADAAYQPLDSDLTAIAALTTTAYGRSLLAAADAAALRTLAALGSLATASSVTAADVSDASANGRSLITAADYAAMRTLLGLVVGTNVQAFDAELAALAGLTSAADRLPYFTGSGTADVATLTAQARTLLAASTRAAQRAAIDLGVTHPADHNLLAWAFDPSCLQGGIAPAAGTVVLIRIPIPFATTVTTIWLDFQAAGSGLTTDQNWAGLYDTSGTLLGATLDQTTNWSSLGIRECTLNTAPVAVAAGFVYVAILSNGTTRPTIRRGLNTQGVNIGLSAPSLRYATGPTGQTTLPSSITMASTSAYANAIWAAIA